MDSNTVNGTSNLNPDAIVKKPLSGLDDDVIDMNGYEGKGPNDGRHSQFFPGRKMKARNRRLRIANAEMTNTADWQAWLSCQGACSRLLRSADQ